jgi:hypothetical protein
MEEHPLLHGRQGIRIDCRRTGHGRKVTSVPAHRSGDDGPQPAAGRRDGQRGQSRHGK